MKKKISEIKCREWKKIRETRVDWLINWLIDKESEREEEEEEEDQRYRVWRERKEDQTNQVDKGEERERARECRLCHRLKVEICPKYGRSRRLDGPEIPMLAHFSNRLRSRCSPSWGRENGEFYFSLSSSKLFISSTLKFFYFRGCVFLVCVFWTCLGLYICELYIAVLDLNLSLGLDIWTIYLSPCIWSISLSLYVWSISLDLCIWIYLWFDAFERYPDLIHIRSLFMFVLFTLYALELYRLSFARKFFSVYCCSCSVFLFYYIVALVIKFFVLSYIWILNYIIDSMQLRFFFM